VRRPTQRHWGKKNVKGQQHNHECSGEQTIHNTDSVVLGKKIKDGGEMTKPICSSMAGKKKKKPGGRFTCTD